MPCVSVVVPTRNRPDSLRRLLDAVTAQDFDPARYEVIVADDGASASTHRQVEAIAARLEGRGPRLRYIPVRGAHGPAAARNRGWQAARGAIIAFTDDDCVPCPDWLCAGMRAFDAGVAGVSGRIVVPLTGTPTDYERSVANLERSEFVTANCFYRREVLAAVGGFDERFALAWREDSDLYFRLLDRCARLVRAPHAVVLHPVRRAGWGVSLWGQRKSMFNALLYKKHPALYRQRVQAAAPWRYYLTVGALCVASLGLATRRRGAALAGGLAWTGLTAHFCQRRLRGCSHAPGHVLAMAVTSALIPPLAVYWRLRGAIAFRVWFL